MVGQIRPGRRPAHFVNCGGGDSGGDSDADSTTTDAQATLVAQPSNPTAVPATETPAATHVATEGELFLQMISPPESEVFTETGNLAVVGRTRVDAVVTMIVFTIQCSKKPVWVAR